MINIPFLQKHAPKVMSYTSLRQSNLVLVFDTMKETWLFANGLPLDNNGMMVVIDTTREVLYGWGGEGNLGCFEGKAYGVHSGLTLKMTVVWNDDV